MERMENTTCKYLFNTLEIEISPAEKYQQMHFNYSLPQKPV